MHRASRRSPPCVLPTDRHGNSRRDAIRETLRTGQLVVLESTTYQGTTDEVLRTILEAPVKYYRAFLYTETDNNDLNYFLLQQLGVATEAPTTLMPGIEMITRPIGTFLVEVILPQQELMPRQIMHDFTHMVLLI